MRETATNLDLKSPVTIKPEWVLGPKASEETAEELLRLIETVASSGYKSSGTDFKMRTLPEGLVQGKVTLIVQSQADRQGHPDKAYASCFLRGGEYNGMRISYTDPEVAAPWLRTGIPSTEAATQEAIKVIKENLTSL